jgi:hypothetical protein
MGQKTDVVVLEMSREQNEEDRVLGLQCPVDVIEQCK